VHRGQILAVIYNADLEKKIRQFEGTFRQAESRYRELINGSRKQDIEEAAANTRRAESQLELARRNEDRDRKLWEQEVVSISRLDATVAERKKAEAELQAAKERYTRIAEGERSEVVQAAAAEMQAQKYALESLQATYEKTLIRSPLDGVVLFRHRNTSEFADVGDPVLEVADLSEIIVEGDVNEIDAGRVQQGRKVIVTSDAFPGQEFSGEVYEVNAALKRRDSEPEDPSVIIDQKVLPVKVRFLQQVPMKLGMKVDLKIL
jgi:multidrug resistance efflux pump